MSGAVLFLDFDGVLNCQQSFMEPRRGKHRIDREKVALLTEVVSATGCKVVISSAWRGNDRCKGILRDYGFKGSFHRDWRTRWNKEYGKIRGDEIAEWLARNGSPSFAIVDDDSDMLDWQQDRFVKTSFEDGLTREHADVLIGLLSAATPSQPDTKKEGA